MALILLQEPDARLRASARTRLVPAMAHGEERASRNDWAKRALLFSLKANTYNNKTSTGKETPISCQWTFCFMPVQVKFYASVNLFSRRENQPDRTLHLISARWTKRNRAHAAAWQGESVPLSTLFRAIPPVPTAWDTC